MYITRTVRHYKHLLVRFDSEGRVCENISFEALHPLGQRSLQKYLKEHDMVGYVLVKVDKMNKNYRMPLDKFMELAEEVTNEMEEV